MTKFVFLNSIVGNLIIAMTRGYEIVKSIRSVSYTGK